MSSFRQRLFSTTKKDDTLPEPVSVPDTPPLNDNDREQSSLSVTLNSRRVPFYRRITSSKEGALSDTSINKSPRSSPSNSQSRPSLFARVVHRVVPCVGPDPALLAQPADDTLVQPELPSEPEPQTISTPPDPLTLDIPLTIPSIPGHPPPSPADSEIIVTPPPSSHLLPEDETDGVTSGAVQPPGSTGDIPRTASTTLSDDSDAASYTDDEPDAPIDDEETLIAKGGSGIPVGPDGNPQPLLPPLSPEHAGRKCLVLDLDETLVHSSFKAVQQADFIVPVEIEHHWHHFHVLKRPGVDDFLLQLGSVYEIVVFTASLSKYADPVLDKLDPHRVVAHRLFRESCYSHKGNYVKDLSQLGRPIEGTIILDNSPASYIFHQRNAVPVSSWFNDPHDGELGDLVPFLRDLSGVGDVRGVLDGAR